MFSVFVRRFWLSFGVVTLLTFVWLPITQAQTNTTLLQKRLNDLDISAVHGKVGIGVLNLNNGKSWFLNGKQRFPMQSVFKLPGAIAVLKKVDDGKLSLDQSVTITRQELAPGWSPIAKEFKGNNARFTVRDLLERSIEVSDNTANDALVRLIGGPKQVKATLDRLKIRDVRVDRLEQQLQPEIVGLKFQTEFADEQKFSQAVQKVPDQRKKASLEKYFTDPRDTATPEAMVNLLAKLQSNQLLSKNSTAFLLKIMTDSPTGQKRLKAGLPQDWSIAHKTGTGDDVLGIGTATNDVGIASSSHGEHVVMAVFIADSKAPLEEREKLMSNLSKIVVAATN